MSRRQVRIVLCRGCDEEARHVHIVDAREDRDLDRSYQMKEHLVDVDAEGGGVIMRAQRTMAKNDG